MSKKNVTLAFDEDLLQRGRVLAAMRRTSLNDMMRDFIQREVESELGKADRSETWSRLFQQSDADVLGRRAKVNDTKARSFNREEFYEEVYRERGLL